MNISGFNIPIHTFNYYVNQSGDMIDKQRNWKDHRRRVMTLIDHGRGRPIDRKSVIVFGAGNCNDLDLVVLTSDFDKIVLTDVDIQSVREGIKRQDLGQAFLDKIRVERIEYTGFEAIGFFEDLGASIEKKASLEEIIDLIERSMVTVENTYPLQNYEGAFDMVLSSPVYTQLILTQLGVILDLLKKDRRYKTDEIEAIEEIFLRHMPKIIRRYNDLLVSMAKPNGSIVVWSDMLQLNPEHEQMTRVKAMLNGEEGPKALEDYVDRDGLGIGSYGCMDLMDKIEMVTSQWWIWPFDDTRHFLVKGTYGHVKDHKINKL